MDKNIGKLRKQTDWFIGLDPTTVTLKTTTTTKLPGGGTKVEAGTSRAPQDVKLIWPGGITSGIFTNFDGEDVKYDMILVAKHDADMTIGDYWEENGVKYSIEGFAPANFYEKKAAIKVHGRSPRGG